MEESTTTGREKIMVADNELTAMKEEKIEKLEPLPIKLKQPMTYASGHQQIHVSWQRIPRAQTYQLEYEVGTMEHDDWIANETNRVNTGFSRGENYTLTLHHATPCVGSLYRYRVRAKNRTGWGPFSAYSTPCIAENKGIRVDGRIPIFYLNDINSTTFAGGSLVRREHSTAMH